jgi:hypothetical protein
LAPIRVIDDSGNQGLSRGLKYTTVDAKRSAWNGRYPIVGAIHARLCGGCGRVFLYAERDQDRLPLPGEAPAPDAAGLPLPARQLTTDD